MTPEIKPESDFFMNDTSITNTVLFSKSEEDHLRHYFLEGE